MYIYATLCIGACTALASCTHSRPHSFLQRRRARPARECRMWEFNGSVVLGADESPWTCGTPSWYTPPYRIWFWVSRRIFIYSHHNTFVLFSKMSVRLSVRLWTESCPLCIFNNTRRIHFIFAHLIKQKNWNFGKFFKFVTLTLSFFLTRDPIWLNSMGNHEAAGGYPQNAGILVVLVQVFMESVWH